MIRPDGAPGLFGLSYLGSGATVVALDDDRNLFLVREYK